MFAAYESFFTAEYSNSEVKIRVKKALTDTILNSSSVVPLTLQAEVTGTSLSARAVVNIEVICKQIISKNS